MFKKFINKVIERTVDEAVESKWLQLTDKFFDDAYESEILPVVTAVHSRESVSAVNFVEIAKWMDVASTELERVKKALCELDSNSPVQLHSASESLDEKVSDPVDVASKFSEIFDDLEAIKTRLAVMESTYAKLARSDG